MRLILELEGGTKPKKPVPSLVSVDRGGGVMSDGLLVRKSLANPIFKPTAFDDKVRSAFKKVTENPVRKPRHTQARRHDEGSSNVSSVTKLSSAAIGGLSKQTFEAIAKFQDQQKSIAAAWRDSPAWKTLQHKPVEVEEADRAAVIAELRELGL
ncbi:hypothetical protein [Olsenella uli]|uniref:hypothetical protein n=1 Tax=Olsenella uli TaxID=133926 RepID=UPI0011D0E78D|nr:hypothetical protein [Olsenella uli]